MKKVIIFICSIVILFGIVLYLPLGVNEHTSEISNIKINVPKFSSFKEECCMYSATFSSIRSTYSLKKDIQKELKKYEKISCSGQEYYYNEEKDYTVTEYNVENKLFINNFSITYSNGNFCNGTNPNSLNLDASREKKINQEINLSSEDMLKQMEELGNVIKDKVNQDFDWKEYRMQYSSQWVENTTSGMIYDFNLNLGGARTSIGYTVVLNADMTLVESSYDNMEGYKPNELKNLYTEIIQSKISMLTAERKEEIKTNALKILDNSSIKAKRVTDEYTWFDIKNNKLYYAYNIEMTTKEIENNETWIATAANIYQEEI